MADAFGEKYSRYYDLLYAEKDYEKECDYLEGIFAAFSDAPVKRIRDIACGTGGHDIPLAARGYRVVGSDASKWMVGEARRKARFTRPGDGLSVRVGDMRMLEASGSFDACICMFSSVGYITSLGEVERVFESVRRLLSTSGIFVVDFWNGLAVLKTKPSPTKRNVRLGKLKALRHSSPSLSVFEDTVSVKMRTVVFEKAKALDKFIEIHRVRYFFPSQMRFLLELAGFEVESIHPFMHLGKKPSETDWNLTAVAKVVATKK